MSFQSLLFLAFLVITVPLCLFIGQKKSYAGLCLLAAACAIFCLLGNRGFATLWIFLIGCQVTKWTERRFSTAARCRALALGCGYHIAVLCAFKYLPLGWSPAGISFFTFQQIWHMKEVYTGAYTPDRKDSLPLYALFFPTVTSGPILKPQEFFPQLRGETFLRPGEQDIAAGLYAICTGMAKKVLLADPIGVMVNNGWAMADSLSAPAAWLVILGYTIQLYLDFSGYCDTATGIARLLGIHLPANFNSPYHACSVTEFWKRWHITLTSFLRECVYFPLGGSHRGVVRAYLNIFIVFLVSGIWHGTGWTFLIWGALHGLAQIVERALGDRRSRLPRWAQWTLTFLFVNAAWVFFRAPTLSAAMTMFSSALSGGWDPALEALTVGVLDSEVTAITTLLPMLSRYLPALLTAILLGTGMTVILWPKNTLTRMETFRPRPLHAVLLAMLLVWSVLSFSSTATFIYSNF